MNALVWILALVAAALAVIAVIFLSPVGKMIFGGDEKSVAEAISLGRLEIGSERDVDRYFEFMTPEEVSALLNEANASGTFKFLMPQFDIIFNGSPIVIGGTRTEIEGREIYHLGITGLKTGSKIYSSIDGFAAGSYRGDKDPSYVSIEEALATDETETQEGVIKRTYISTISEGIGSPFLSGLDDIFRRVDLSTPIAPILSERGLPTSLAPNGYQLSLVIEKGEDMTLADFRNILLSKNGKIVMVKR